MRCETGGHCRPCADETPLKTRQTARQLCSVLRFPSKGGIDKGQWCTGPDLNMHPVPYAHHRILGFRPAHWSAGPGEMMRPRTHEERCSGGLLTVNRTGRTRGEEGKGDAANRISPVIGCEGHRPEPDEGGIAVGRIHAIGYFLGMMWRHDVTRFMVLGPRGWVGSPPSLGQADFEGGRRFPAVTR